MQDRQYNLYSMRSLAEAYAAKTVLMEGTDDFKFPTDMSFDNTSDSSILQGSTDLLKEMFEYIIQNNAYVVPYIPHLQPKFLAWGARGMLSEFDQSEFSTDKNVERTGLIYVPHNCTKQQVRCHIHIALHGVGQSLQDLKDKNPNFSPTDYTFATQTGYIQYGASNDFIIVFP